MAVAFAASILLFSAATWYLGIVLLLPLALFAAGFLGASSLRISANARTGLGIVVAVGGFGSFGSLLGTQGLTGHEGAAEVFLGLGVWFLISYGIGSALGLPLARELGTRTLGFGFLGFCGGALLAAGFATLDIFDVLPTSVSGAWVSLAIPAAVGGGFLARARR